MPRYLCTVEVQFETHVEAKDKSEAVSQAEDIFYREADFRNLELDIECREVEE